MPEAACLAKAGGRTRPGSRRGRPGALTRRVLLLLVWVLQICTPSAHADEDYLAPDKAFAFRVAMADARTVLVTYAIADGYYMYRERFLFTAEGATLGAPVFPQGKIKFDETFQHDVETYRHAVTIRLPVEAAGGFTLHVTGQGCADRGLCYAPMEAVAKLSASGGGLLAALHDGAAGPALSRPARPGSADPGALDRRSAMPASQSGTSADTGTVERALQSGRLTTIVPLFWLLGVGLAFTPCVLPMVPILSSIIVGEGANTSRRRGFSLSLTYALGMALVYTALGVAAGMIGEGLAATLQKPWILAAFALLMVGLSLSMFGVYQLQVPSALQARLAQASQNQRAGKTVGVFLMGALSALIVGPCVAAPLAGALVYISQTRNVLVGGSALFAMAIGMSVPLLLVGLSAGTLLPRAGVWMDAIKRFFGILMLGVAIWMVSPLLTGQIQMLAWAALGIGSGIYLLRARGPGWTFKAIGVMAACLGLLQLAGLASGGRDVLQPLAHLRGPARQPLHFTRIKSAAELDAVLLAESAKAGGRTVLLDFYADWCVSCKEMEKLTFTDQRIRDQLANTTLLQVDVTANDSDDKALLKRFGLFGPPGIILFDRGGQEIPRSRVIGYQNPARFAQSLAALSAT